MSPTLEAREARSVGVAARIRVKGITEKDADKVEGETKLGELALDCRLAPGDEPRNAKLWRAGEFFLLTRKNAMQAKLCKGLTSGSDYDRQPGHDNDEGTAPEYVRWCVEAIAFDEMVKRAIISKAGHWCRSELESVVMQDNDSGNLPFLRQALAIVDTYAHS